MAQISKIQFMLYVALTQLRAKKTQTLVAILSVTLGVAVYIYIAGYVNGANEWLRDITLAESSDVRLFKEISLRDKSILDNKYPNDLNKVYHTKPQSRPLNLKDGKLIVKTLKKDSRIKGISSNVKAQIYYHLGTTNITGSITGVNLNDEDSLFNIKSKLIEGSWDGFSTVPNSVIMGNKLKAKLNLEVGDKVQVLADNGTIVLAHLIGVIKTGIPEIDKEICYASEKTVQNILDVPSSYITEIKIKVHDINISPDIAKELGDRYSLNSSDGQKDNAALFEGAELQDIIFTCIGLSILLVAGFGIFNILNMMIYEKMRDISIIKAMGFSDEDVHFIFITQAVIIGLIGGLMGLLLAFSLAYATSQIPYESDVFVSVDHIPMNFSPIFYLVGLLFAILTTTLAGLLPARKASKLDPVSILR